MSDTEHIHERSGHCHNEVQWMHKALSLVKQFSYVWTLQRDFMAVGYFTRNFSSSTVLSNILFLSF